MSDMVSADVWEQDGPIGASTDGLPQPVVAALDVLPVVAVAGVVQARETPSLMAVSNGMVGLVQGACVQVIGASPQRRRVLISTTVDCVIGTDKGTVQAGFGLPVTATDPPIELRAAVEVFALVTGAGPGTIGFWAEVDPG